MHRLGQPPRSSDEGQPHVALIMRGEGVSSKGSRRNNSNSEAATSWNSLLPLIGLISCAIEQFRNIWLDAVMGKVRLCAI